MAFNATEKAGVVDGKRGWRKDDFASGANGY